MSITVGAQMLPSTRRPIPLRRRPDLDVRRIEYQGIGSYVIKDPVGLKYHRLHAEQFGVLGLLDGSRNLDEIRNELIRLFPTLTVTLNDVQQLITDLHDKGLLQSLRFGQGAALLKHRRAKRGEKIWAFFRNLLYIRLPGWDPERMLKWLHPRLWWIYSPWAVAFCVTLVASSLLLVGTEFSEFRRRLPEFQQFFTVRNMIYLWATVGVTKILHEFGHGLTCKHFGGECHQMGIMLLVFSPTLYCDVSDAWMMRNKWHRIYIGLAGMYVETVLSAVAIFIWWNTNPGLLHYLCLNVFFVSTVSTVIFNANPLMRYDGYFMLADYLEVPNLRPKADKMLTEKFSWYCLGIEQRPDPFMPETGRVWFVTFAIAAAIYRWVIVFGITLFLYRVLKPYGLQSIGIVLAVASLAAVVGNLVYSLYKIVSAPRSDPMDMRKVTITGTVVAIVLAAALFVPLPLHEEMAFMVEPLDVAHVYATAPGRVSEVHVAPGARVSKGDLLVKLINRETEQKRRELEMKRDVQQKELELDRVLNDQAQEKVARTILDGIEKQLADFDRQLVQLELRAPCDGYVIAAPRVPEPTLADQSRQLSRWYGHPLDPENLGCQLTERTHVCSIAPKKEGNNAVLYVDQADRNDIRLGQTVQIQLEHVADRTYSGQIERISDREAEIAPEVLSSKAGGDLATTADSHGHERLTNSAYQATVRLDEDADLLRTGMRGRARFTVERRSAVGWLWRYFRRTFHFRL
ncbi:MAG TPA: HlyD family efflux transporter periplasmic adaptor subunit [Planctomycetaceae bacterium]|jgi:putative peptide zinc metalloprotease protein|nr:HlyD family efflux transporter periplasmic adaptor subunit [Planctomycetaceae bacterium]